MPLFRLLLGLVFLAALRLSAAEPVRVVMATDLGEIEVELFPQQAPGTVENFLSYVDRGFYNGGVFHRTVTSENQPSQPIRIEVIQAGINPDRDAEDGPPITLERTRDTGLRHHDGAISMARLGPDTATSDFFFCIGDQPELDFGGRRNADGQGFAVFGRVVRGMDVVRTIHQSPAQLQKLTPPVRIHSIRRLAP